MEKQSLLKQNSQARYILSLAIIICLIVYSLFIASNLSSGKLCNFLGVDYCAYWAGGRLMNENSIADVYDMDLLRQYQKEIYPTITAAGLEFSELPLPYLPVFIVIFQLTSLIELPYSFVIWVFLNLLTLVLYLRFFVLKVIRKKPPIMLLIMVIISLPVFLNLFYGQVNFLLFICAGEFFRNLLKSERMKAGLWLGIWLLKPQIAILIIPFLIIRKEWKVLLGFIISSLTLFVISFILIGYEGFLRLFNILVSSSQGGAASNAHAMMNWRMIGIYLAYFFNKDIGWGVIIIGSLVTTIAVFLVFSKKKHDEDSGYLCASLFGIFAATGLITWHAHLSMSVVLIPLLIYLLMMEQIDLRIFVWWVFLPILLFSSRSWFNILAHYGLFPESLYALPSFFEALPGFIFNLFFVGWAIKYYRSPKLKIENESIL